MPSFSKMMDRKVEEIKRPPNLPIGHYIFQVMKHPDISEFTSRDGIPFERLTFLVSPVSPLEDVDQGELDAYGDYAKTQVRKQFLIADSDADQTGHDRGMFNLRRFLEHCGIDGDTSLGEAIAATVNAQFVGELTHRPDNEDPEVVYQEIGRTAQPE